MRTLSIVVVHGTFVTQVSWARADGEFAEMLRRALREHQVDWQTFDWSGRNDHASRERAADELTAHCSAWPVRASATSTSLPTATAATSRNGAVRLGGRPTTAREIAAFILRDAVT